MTVVRKLLLLKAGFHEQVSSINLPPLESVLQGGSLVLLLGPKPSAGAHLTDQVFY